MFSASENVAAKADDSSWLGLGGREVERARLVLLFPRMDEERKMAPWMLWRLEGLRTLLDSRLERSELDV